jgi:hypothetical protein
MNTGALHRRRGRPPGEQYPLVRTIRLGNDDLSQLELLRQRHGGTMCELLRRLVRRCLIEEVHGAHKGT